MDESFYWCEPETDDVLKYPTIPVSTRQEPQSRPDYKDLVCHEPKPIDDKYLDIDPPEIRKRRKQKPFNTHLLRKKKVDSPHYQRAVDEHTRKTKQREQRNRDRRTKRKKRECRRYHVESEYMDDDPNTHLANFDPELKAYYDYLDEYYERLSDLYDNYDGHTEYSGFYDYDYFYDYTYDYTYTDLYVYDSGYYSFSYDY